MTKQRSTKRKNLEIKPSGRSSDFIAPSFGFGCLFDCSYCYCKRYKTEGLDIATNIGDILTAVNNHAMFTVIEKPNQTHESFITYDLGCNEDLALHLKYYPWEYIFDFFKTHPRAMGTFATKYYNPKLLEYNPEGKIRIRFSLMPQKISSILEPSTTLIKDRILAINEFIKAGYDVHINFSPVIVYEGWLEDYRELFEEVNSLVEEENKTKVKAEVIFLTHNENKHINNLTKGVKGESLLWNPSLQESKVSQYGGKNIRYRRDVKNHFIKEWTKVHNEVINWNTIRYIF